MFNKILVCIDGSEISRLAFSRALEMAKFNNAEIHTIYIIEAGMVSPGPVDATVDSTWKLIYQRFEAEGKEINDDLLKEGEEYGLTIIPHIETGHAGDVIVKKAVEFGCDLIVLGSRGKSKLDRLLLGSVSSHVVNYGKVNTLVIRD